MDEHDQVMCGRDQPRQLEVNDDSFHLITVIAEHDVIRPQIPVHPRVAEPKNN